MAPSPDMLKEHFEKVSKCQIKGKIYNVDFFESKWCSYDLKLYIRDNEKKYLVNGTMPKKSCIIDSYNIIFFEKDIEIGKNINFILDEKYYPLNFYSGSVNTDNIPYCTGNIIKEQELKSNINLNINNNYIIYGTIIFILLIILICILKVKRRK